MSTEESGETEYAVVLDYMPHGHPDDDRPGYQKSPVAQAVGETRFRLYEATVAEDADVGIGDRIVVQPDADSPADRLRVISYSDLTRGGEGELEYAVEAVVDRHETRFVDFYNDAGPITLRLHQLNLLPGIGKKLRNNVLEARDRSGPYESFDDMVDRVSGLHDPKGVLVDRILEEIREADLKYRCFTGDEPAV